LRLCRWLFWPQKETPQPWQRPLERLWEKPLRLARRHLVWLRPLRGPQRCWSMTPQPNQLGQLQRRRQPRHHWALPWWYPQYL
jgi:hypothetical protein